jgi:beta-1,4-mannosyl-glycoprotein beta-1,4-N-acetylglucosaminyltransferase
MIVDAFPFFQELELLKVRLDYLGEFVDKFIISESEIDFAGNAKNVLLTPKTINQLPFCDKITVVHNKFSTLQTKFLFPITKKIKWRKPLWAIQLKQRNAILPVLQNIKSNGVFMFGDLDEFPDRSEINKIISLISQKPNQVYVIKQTPLVYNLRTGCGVEGWMGTIACSIENGKKSTPNKLRKKRFSTKIAGKGWHFSYFGDSDQIQNKVRSIAPVEKHFNLDDPSLVDISARIKSRVNPFLNLTFDQEEISLNDYPRELISSFVKFMPNSLSNI